MGGQVVFVDDECFAFRTDRLGPGPRANRWEFENSRCGLWRRKNNRKTRRACAGRDSQRPVMALLKSAILTVSDQQKLSSDAGYCDVEIFEERAHGWICVVGKKEATS